ncbi:lytic transglycosylase domain-containing protein|uniref:Transglycosylase SLT domain-containing protein n=1 Tax=Dendrosporobacter quercicolus TaxID=146817 RepID=A0A1G9MK58_9FIRM|nr:lytic transglycosylase domain-containing protein [Dendrosporobacter quercicolus]NSL47060.1 lytic transglycosylase domain-containing protein [Dendrosporobacter quercicolus DSM 1736]SDL74514.1 Transglycosylase SLT domain-containing protein [Dendrosporobacter quercicolus]
MSGIDRVLQRINSIEQRFHLQQAGRAADFQQMLTVELRSGLVNGTKGAAAQEAAAGAKDIQSMIDISSRKYGVDARLITAVARNESNFNPGAVSPAGAAGIMQLMPETAQALGVQNVYDAQENIDGGVKYLKELLTKFNGDVTKAVAAYNAGPQAVVRYQGVPPYRETQDYVGKVLQQYRDSQ